MDKVSRSFKSIMVESLFTPIVFAIAAIVMRIVMYLSIGMPHQEYPTSFVWHIISPIFENDLLSLASSTISIFLIAYIVTQLNLRFNLIRFRTALPFSLIMFFLSIHPAFLPMSPNYLSIILMLLALFPLLHSYQHHSPRNFALESGVLIGLAGIFQIYTLVFLPLWWRGEISMHGFRVKSFLALILGAIIVFWNLAGLFFLFDNLQSFLERFTYFLNINLTIPNLTSIQWYLIGLSITISVVYLLLDLKVFTRERVLAQKVFSFISLILVFSFVLHTLYFHQTFLFLYLIIIMISFIIAHYYSHIKTQWQVYSFIFLLAGSFMFFISSLMDITLLFQ